MTKDDAVPDGSNRPQESLKSETANQHASEGKIRVEPIYEKL